VNENSKPAPAATTAAPDTTSADLDASTAAFHAKEAFGRAHAARFIARLGCLLDELNDYKADGHAPNGGPSGALSFTLDGIMDAALGTQDQDGALGALAPLTGSPEACAAFAVALFGEEITGPFHRLRDWQEDFGYDAQTAFLVARAYLTAPRNSGGSYLLLAAAVAVQRDTRKREEEKNEPATA